jgi:hypothetical protein
VAHSFLRSCSGLLNANVMVVTAISNPWLIIVSGKTLLIKQGNFKSLRGRITEFRVLTGPPVNYLISNSILSLRAVATMSRDFRGLHSLSNRLP